MKNTIIVDANVILRYLLNDNQEQSKKANQTKPNFYSTKNLDFVGLILLAYAKNHHRKIFTFDKKLKKEIKDIEKRKKMNGMKKSW